MTTVSDHHIASMGSYTGLHVTLVQSKVLTSKSGTDKISTHCGDPTVHRLEEMRSWKGPWWTVQPTSLG